MDSSNDSTVGAAAYTGVVNKNNKIADINVFLNIGIPPEI